MARSYLEVPVCHVANALAQFTDLFQEKLGFVRDLL